MMRVWMIVTFLTFMFASVVADNYYEKVTARTLQDYFKELQRLEKNSKDFSHQSIEKIQEKFKGLSKINCNDEMENANLILNEIYQAFENLQMKTFQNTQEIKVMKEILKKLATQMPDRFEINADLGLKSINKVEFKQQELLPASSQLEKSANMSQSVQTLPQTVRHSSNTIETKIKTSVRPTFQNYRNSSEKENGTDLPGDVPDCETPPLPSTYCHQYQILWYYSSKEGRCNRFRKGCEETFRNSYNSERECRDTCVRPGFEEKKACFLPRSPGICKGVEIKWYFDWEENRCKDFIYKGCLGNQNRFPDEKTCSQQCGSITLQSAVEQGLKVSKSEYKRKQINTFVDNDHETEVAKKPAHSEALLPAKDPQDTKKSIQDATALKESDGHYPDYIPYKNQLFPPSNKAKKSLSDQSSPQQKNYFPIRIPVNKYMINVPEYNSFRQTNPSHFNVPMKVKSGIQTDPRRNSIQSTLPNYKYEQNNKKSVQTYDSNKRNDVTNYLDEIAKKQQWTGQEYDQNPAKNPKKKTIFKGGYRNRKRKSRQYLYLYNDHHKRRSKVSKTQNLRVELHAPKNIGIGDQFKLKCIVSGSLAEAVDIIWDKDDASDKKSGVKWKKKERTRMNTFSNKKTSTLYVPGIHSSVRFTCLVSCYDPQKASLLPRKLEEKEKVERVESYLCAFDSVNLKPSDGFEI